MSIVYSILYPLTIPGSIGPIEANLKKMESVGEFIGPFDGSAQQQQWLDQHWELDLVWPEMTWAQAAALDAFLGALHGKIGSFLWGPPLAAAPRGSGGTPTADNAALYNAPRSNLLTMTGLPAPESAILLPGDFLQLYTIPQSIAIASVEIAGSYLYVTLQAPPLPGSMVPYTVNPLFPTLVTFQGLTHATWLNPPDTTDIFLYDLSGAVLQFNYGGSAYGPTADTGYISFPGSLMPLTRLHQYVGNTPVATVGDPPGGATIDIWPSIRETPPYGSPISLINPSGLFRLAENKREAPAKRNKTFTFSMKCREAI